MIRKSTRWTIRQLVFWLPAILSFAGSAIIGNLQIEIGAVLNETVPGKPQAWVVLPPALKLIGALVLLTIPGNVTKEDKEWAKGKAIIHADGQAKGETYDEYKGRWSRMQQAMLSSLRPKLKRFENGVGFGFLSLGLLVGVLAITRAEPAPLHWAANILLGVSATILVIKIIIWEAYRNHSRGEVLEEMKVQFP